VVVVVLLVLAAQVDHRLVVMVETQPQRHQQVQSIVVAVAVVVHLLEHSQEPTADRE
jgi:hypothetical protein